MDDFKYIPPDGLLNREYFPTQPVDEDAARAQFQDMYNQVLDFLNSYKNALQKNTGSNCGASLIGSTKISGLNGTDVYSQISALKAQVTTIATYLGLPIG